MLLKRLGEQQSDVDELLANKFDANKFDAKLIGIKLIASDLSVILFCYVLFLAPPTGAPTAVGETPCSGRRFDFHL